jgi:hypothetical protein
LRLNAPEIGASEVGAVKPGVPETGAVKAKQKHRYPSLEVWTAIGVVVNAIAVVAVAAAGLIAYLQYRAGIGQESVKQTVDFLKLTYSEPVGPAQQRIWISLSVKKDEITNQLIKNKETLPPAQRSAAFQAIMASLISGEKLGKDINQVFAFYNQIAICVNSEICDYTSAKIFFHDDMEDFASWFEPYLVDNARQINRTYSESEFYKLLTRMRASRAK